MTNSTMRFARIIVLFLLSFHSALSFAQSEKYYVVVFSYEGEGNLAKHSHTFASFVKTTARSSRSRVRLREDTISFLPAKPNFEIELMKFLPEPGRNYSLKETLQLAKQRGSRVKRWGPIRIDKVLYQRALKRIDFLNSGRVKYKAVDSFFRRAAFDHEGGALNCIHAVSDVSGKFMILNQWGSEASESIFQRFYSHNRLSASTSALKQVTKRLGIKNIAQAE